VATEPRTLCVAPLSLIPFMSPGCDRWHPWPSGAGVGDDGVVLGFILRTLGRRCAGMSDHVCTMCGPTHLPALESLADRCRQDPQRSCRWTHTQPAHELSPSLPSRHKISFGSCESSLSIQ
jgi:hypothetical protein